MKPANAPGIVRLESTVIVLFSFRIKLISMNRKIAHKAYLGIGMKALKMVANYTTPWIEEKGQTISLTAPSTAIGHEALTLPVRDLATVAS